MTVKEYIKSNWKNTIKTIRMNNNRSKFKLPKAYSTPCVNALFINFFYWDTYFANIGLMLDGYGEQVVNNLDVMKFFVDFLGYVPNADHLVTRTQPPLFTRAVYDYYKKTGDKSKIEKYIDALIREMSFFENDRITECGLNAYGNNETNTGKLWYYDEFNRRLKYNEDEKKMDKVLLVDHLLAIAESGWDFNPRFIVEGNEFAACDFAHLDLNCILYDAEIKIAEMLSVIGRNEEVSIFFAKAEKRKELINKLMLDKESGIYYDYNFKENSFSRVLSCASFYPYALGISNDAESLKKVLQKLELPFGISACEYRGENNRYFQWDYPNMWPSNMYFAFLALKNVGLKEDAERIKNKYISTVDNVFEKTGELWEKYNARECLVSECEEYITPEMMGWTAGIYRYFEEVSNLKE